jgi:hypothetical protein
VVEAKASVVAVELGPGSCGTVMEPENVPELEMTPVLKTVE